jgi:hypothetical protein
MAWIEVHQSLPSHRKTSKLMRALDIKTRAQAVGHLVMLWLWALDNAPTGNLREIDPDDVAEAAGWSGDSGKLLAALEKSGYLDEDGSVHDWGAYAGRLIDKRAANAKRNRESRAKKNASRDAESGDAERITSASRAHHERITSASRDVATVPYRTLPYPTVPLSPLPSHEGAGAEGGGEREFLPPTIEQAREYANAAGLDVDAEAFVKANEAAGWKDSEGRPIRNWMAWMQGSHLMGGQAATGVPAGKSLASYEQREYDNKQLAYLFEDDVEG